ncbi:MAG: 4-aminobutyrate--2-oxoglutarate transaminase [Thermoleophilia bacterium]|nr:4-aminobutyrate--2-oxoglutarate transaminase [Thermoleophilia bacterium]
MQQATTTQGSVKLVTEVPGPKSRALVERSAAALPQCMSLHLPLFVDHCEGALLTDVDGNTFIDWAGGVGCLNVGHVNPRVRDAIVAQVEKFTHTDYTVLPYETYVRLAERLNELAPISGKVKTAFFNTGAEAVENSIKIAKAATGRAGVICFDGAFHGRSLMAMSLTSKVHPYKAGFGPFASEVYRAPYANSMDFGGDAEAASEHALMALRRMFKTHVAAETVAALIVEPVQGEGGFLVPAKSFLAGLRDICSEHGIVLIFDEVQSGMGRCGTLFATEQFGIEPDLLLSAKSIAMGMPLSAVIGKAAIMDMVPDSGIGGTYPGNPVAIEAAHAVLDEFADGLLEQSDKLGKMLARLLDEIAASDDGIADSRGLGPMRALEFRSAATGKPDSARVSRIIEEAAQRGLILLKAGINGEVVRVLVPLVITDAQVDESIAILREAITASALFSHPAGSGD